MAATSALRPSANIYVTIIIVSLLTAPLAVLADRLLLGEALERDGRFYLVVMHLSLGGFLFHFMTLPDRSVTLRILVEVLLAPGQALSARALGERYGVKTMITSRLEQLSAARFLEISGDTAHRPDAARGWRSDASSPREESCSASRARIEDWQREQEGPGPRRRRGRLVDGVLPHREGLRSHPGRKEQPGRRTGAHVLLQRPPYEFGPHIWFWPGGEEDPINNTIVRLTNNELFHIDRRLFTYVEADRRKYRYPVHYQDIDEMPERETIHRELNQHRDNAQKLIQEQLPELGQCTFADYFTAAIGQTLYQKFMANYTWKMWNIPGDELQTSMVWADRFHHAYTKTGEKAAPRGLGGYDPIKFEDHTLGKGIRFQVYPKGGWNEVWNAMVARSTVVRDRVVGIRDEHKQPYVLMASGEKYHFADYHTVFCSIDIDDLWGEDTLPYTGRMMIPLLIPGLEGAFPGGAESLHYSSCEFQTRVTEMKVITRHESPDTLILIEVPVLPGAAQCFPKNTIDYALENNLFTEKAYPQQSEQAFATYHSYVERGKKIPNLRYVGRHAEFKYWGMPETVNSAYLKALEFPAV